VARQTVRKYTVDASVAVKWYIDEEGSEKARSIKSRFVEGLLELNAPTLLQYEVANALRTHPVAKVDTRHVSNAVKALGSYGFLIHPTLEAWMHAIQLSFSHKISIYDCIYLGVSRMLGCPLVTADERLIRLLPESERDHVLDIAKTEFD